MYDDFELIKTFKTIIAEKFPLRLYRSRFYPTDINKPIEKYRYHFGFPEALVKPICLLLETTLFWGEEHWKEEDGFWIWWLTIIGGANDKLPFKALQKQLDRMLKSRNSVIKFLKKGGK